MTDKLKDKISKLLAYAESTNHLDRDAFMAKAMRLIVENGLSVKDFENQKQETENYSSQDMDKGKRKPTEDSWIFSILIEFFNVQIVTTGSRENGKRACFIGKPSNIEVAFYLYDYLYNSYQLAWYEYKLNTGASVKAKSAFYQGITHGLKAKLKKERGMLESEYGIVIAEDPGLDQKMRELFPRLIFPKKYFNRDENAKNEGFNVGSNMNINMGVTGSNSRKLIGS